MRSYSTGIDTERFEEMPLLNGYERTVPTVKWFEEILNGFAPPECALCGFKSKSLKFRKTREMVKTLA
jgi:hypothetical protein